MSENSNSFAYKKLYSLNYYRLNKDKILEHKKIYYKHNKNDILEQAKTQYYSTYSFNRKQCECCKSRYTRKYILKHQRSNKCKHFQQLQL